MKRYGFSLLELMIVIAIIAVLAVMAVPTYKNFLARSKRAEAYAHLHALYIAEQAYFAEHGEYTDKLSGEGGLGFDMPGKHLYTYGFANGGGDSAFEGSLKAPSSALAGTSASGGTFVVGAAADIDGGVADVLTVDQTGEIKIAVDDTKNA